MAGRPDVLVVVLDSMRKDRVSTYGHRRATTPTLTELADGATTFESAYTPAPWTLPSHCSMFTGTFPSEHGVTNGFADASVRLPDCVEPLGEHLADAGYRTAGFSNNPWVGQLSGLDRGFDEFVEWDLEISRSADEGLHGPRERGLSRLHAVLGNAARQPVFLLKRRFFTGRLVDRATDWIARTADGAAPTFTFLNLMEAHSPYFPPSSAFAALDLPTPGPVEPRVLNTKLLGYVMGNLELDGDRRRRVMEYYDASLRYQDGQLARLLDALREHGAYDDTLVVVCADHGKTLGEYAREETPPHYTRNLNVDVPLVVKRPGQRTGAHEAAPVELTGLHDLVLSGGETTLAAASGDGGVALVEDHVPHAGAETPDDVTRWRAVTDGDRRLVRGEDGEEYLFVVGDGTDERAGDPGTARDLRDRLDERVAALGTPTEGDGEAADLDRTVEGQLRDLGYM